MRKLLQHALLFTLLANASACQQPSSSRDNAMSKFVDDYFTAYFEWNPSAATSVGFHQYDDKLEDYSAAAVKNRIQKLKQLQTELAQLPSTRTTDEAIDLDILDDQIRAELLDLEILQTWRHNPMNYVFVPGGAVDNLIKRNFA